MTFIKPFLTKNMPALHPTSSSANGPLLQLAVVLLPGFLDSSLGATLTIAKAANTLRKGWGQEPLFQVKLVSPQVPQIHSAAGLPVATETLDALQKADLIVIPGAFLDSAQGIKTWLSEPTLMAWVAYVPHLLPRQHLAASCAGTWALAEAGLLNGRHATSVWWLGAEFRRCYPKVHLDLNALVLNDGPITTAGAAFAHTDLMLHLVARWGGAALAEHCARLLMLDLRQSQSRNLKLAWLAQSDPLMNRMHRWIERHLAEPINIDALAKAMSLTPRTLARRSQEALGLSPWRMVQRQRIEAAVQLLKTTGLPFEKVAVQVGYADASALRRLLRREMGLGPQALRTP